MKNTVKSIASMSHATPLPRAASLLGAAILSTLLLNGCANQTPTSSLPVVQQQFAQAYAHQGLLLTPGVQALAAPTPALAAPLTLPQSLQALLQYSPQVRAAIARLGIADADVLQAELIANPQLSLGAMRPEDSGRWKIETGISQPLLSFFTRPLQRKLAAEQQLAAQLQLQQTLQQLLATTTQAWYSAVAAQQAQVVYRQVLAASEAQTALAQRLLDAGNISQNRFLQYKQASQLDALALIQADNRAQQARLVLLQHLGLASSTALQLPLQLPEAQLPEAQLPKPPSLPSPEQPLLLRQALLQRVDIQLLQQQHTYLQQRQQLIAQENGWRDMSLGINVERETSGDMNAGPEVALALPLFNRGQGKLAVISAQLDENRAHLAQQTVQADSEIASALLQQQQAQQRLALLHSALPLAEKRLLLSLREVNFMLTSPFELLADKRDAIALQLALVEATKDYWLAHSQLSLAMGGPVDAAIASPPEQQADHSHHQGSDAGPAGNNHDHNHNNHEHKPSPSAQEHIHD